MAFGGIPNCGLRDSPIHIIKELWISGVETPARITVNSRIIK